MGGSEGSDNVTLALWMTAWDGLCHIEKPMGGLESGNAGDDRLGGGIGPAKMKASTGVLEGADPGASSDKWGLALLALKNQW